MDRSDLNQNTYRDREGIVDVAPPKPKLRKPPMYKVVMLNDDYTPQVFVVQLLQELFHMDYGKASMVMLAIHVHGQGVCGVYPRDVAEMKVAGTHRHARQHNYPLRCRMEPE